MDKIHGCRLMFLVALAMFVTGTATPAFSEPMLKMVNIDAESAGAVKKLAGMGLDIAAVRRIGADRGEEDSLGRRFRVEAVVSALDEIKLKKAGIKWSAAQQATGMRDITATAAAETVYHSFDEPDLGIKDQLYTIAKRNPHITKLKTIGYSIQGRPLLAMRLTKTWGFHHYYFKPKVLFVATHHAREWVATQMAMRLIKYLTDNYRSDKRVTRLLLTTEIWVIPVANPDGYE